MPIGVLQRFYICVYIERYIHTDTNIYILCVHTLCVYLCILKGICYKELAYTIIMEARKSWDIQVEWVNWRANDVISVKGHIAQDPRGTNA